MMVIIGVLKVESARISGIDSIAGRQAGKAPS
jgi:hypothetical protein